jgi:hypothetical protein
MTIIHPKKIKQKKNSPIFIIGLIMIVGLTAGNAIVYTKTVAIEHDTADARKSLDAARSENAELKNSWYEAVNGENMERLVKDYGFIKTTSPRYIQS